MEKCTNGRLLVERAIDDEEAPKARSRRDRPACSVTVNLAESAIGWLHSRGLVTRRQFGAGGRLRGDWERAQLSARVTMAWDAAPISGRRGGSGGDVDLKGSQIDAKRRFHPAIDAAGPGFPISCGAWSAQAKGCARQKRRLAGQRERAS
jgi:hypothetical protein